MLGSAYRHAAVALACSGCGEHLRKEDALLSTKGEVQCRRCSAAAQVADANDVLSGAAEQPSPHAYTTGSGAGGAASAITILVGILALVLGSKGMGTVFILGGAISACLVDIAQQKKQRR